MREWFAKYRRSRLSETARSILWLWESDPSGWVIGSHAVCHPGARVGAWTANRIYGLHVEHHCDVESARTGHLRGHKIEMNRRDRKALYAACGTQPTLRHGGPVPFAISEWTMRGDKFAEKVPS